MQIGKNGRPLADWLETEAEKDKILRQAYIPTDIPLDIQHFGVFYEARKEILRKRLVELLGGK